MKIYHYIIIAVLAVSVFFYKNELMNFLGFKPAKKSSNKVAEMDKEELVEAIITKNKTTLSEYAEAFGLTYSKLDFTYYYTLGTDELKEVLALDKDAYKNSLSELFHNAVRSFS